MRTRPTHTVALVVAAALGAIVAAPSLSVAGTSTTVPTTAPTLGAGGPEGPFCSSIPPEGEGSFVGMADDPVATAASNNPYLTTLTAAVQAAGLVDTLNAEGPFTVFAPNNEAFAAVPPADLDAVLADIPYLTDILTHHVVIGQRLRADELVEAGKVVTASGAALTFTREADGSVSINGGAAHITCAYVPTINAMVQIIDRVIIPPPALAPIR